MTLILYSMIYLHILIHIHMNILDLKLLMICVYVSVSIYSMWSYCIVEYAYHRNFGRKWATSDCLASRQTQSTAAQAWGTSTTALSWRSCHGLRVASRCRMGPIPTFVSTRSTAMAPWSRRRNICLRWGFDFDSGLDNGVCIRSENLARCHCGRA